MVTVAQGCKTEWNKFYCLFTLNIWTLYSSLNTTSKLLPQIIFPPEHSSPNYSHWVTPSCSSRLCTAVTFSVTPILTNLFKSAVCPSSTKLLSLLFNFSLLCLFFAFCLLMLEYKRARIFCVLCFLLMDSGT